MDSVAIKRPDRRTGKRANQQKGKAMSKKRFFIHAVTICFLMLAFGCAAPTTFLTVDYRVPGASGMLHGQGVRLEVTDARSDPAVLTPPAAARIQGFKGRFHLLWQTGEEEKRSAGFHGLSNLFRTAFEKRLALLGVAVAPAADTGAPLLTVTVREFRVDLAQRRWTAALGYDAELSLADGTRITETVAGSAERLRIYGRKGVDELLGEIFSETVNRLDIRKLFVKAGRI